MAKWIYLGRFKNLERYQCSSCGNCKDIMHTAKGSRRPNADGSPNIFRCPNCKEEIHYLDSYPNYVRELTVLEKRKLKDKRKYVRRKNK